MLTKEKEKISVGVVESIDDPTFSGRIKVRVLGYHDNIPTEQLPWCSYSGASVFSGSGGGSISIPRVGTKVRVQFKQGDNTSMEWMGVNQLDEKLRDEIKDDYAGTHVLLYDSASDVTIKYQPKSGLVIYYGGSFIQIQPNNNIMIHYGEGASGTQIQLSKDQIDIQAPTAINITSQNSINLDAENIVINGNTSVQIKGDTAGQSAVNGNLLVSALQNLANMIDVKIPQSGAMAQSYVTALKDGILNSGIQYI